MPSKTRNSGGKAGAPSPSPNVSSTSSYPDAEQVPHLSSGSSTSLQAQGGDEDKATDPQPQGEGHQEPLIELNSSINSTSTTVTLDSEVVINAAIERLDIENMSLCV